MRDAPAVVRDLDPPEDQLVVALLEAVEVEAVADSEGEDRGGGGRGGVDGCCCCCCGGGGDDGAGRSASKENIFELAVEEKVEEKRLRAKQSRRRYSELGID